MYTYYNDSDQLLYLDFPKLAATPYTVTLSGKVADPYGNTLGQDYVLRFSTRDYDPVLQLNGQGQVGTYNAYTDTQAVVLYRNTPEVRFDLYSVTPEEFLVLTGRDAWQKWDRYRPQEAESHPGVVATHHDADATRPISCASRCSERTMRRCLPGIYYLGIDGALPSGQRSPRQLLVRSDMNVTLKAAPDEALAWVTDLKTGQPVSGATVRFADNGGNDVQAVTGADGVARAKLTAPRRSLGPVGGLRQHRRRRVRRRLHRLAGRHQPVGLRRAGRVRSGSLRRLCLH